MEGPLWFLAILLFAWMLIRIPEFKYLVAGVAGVAALAAAGFGLWLWHAQRMSESERPVLASNEYSLTDLSLSLGPWEEYRLPDAPQQWRLTAKVTNKSKQHTITEIAFKILPNDCQGPKDPIIDPTCVQIGEDRVTIPAIYRPGRLGRSRLPCLSRTCQRWRASCSGTLLGRQLCE